MSGTVFPDLGDFRTLMLLSRIREEPYVRHKVTDLEFWRHFQAQQMRIYRES